MAKGMPLICRDVEVYPYGPAQFHDPPLMGCGPRFTVEPDATVAEDSSAQAPLFTWIYGVIAVDVQLVGITTAVAE